MKRKTFSAAVIALFTLLAVPVPSFAESNAISTMARILTELNHYPSAEQKATLAAISKDENSSDATRAIAEAIHNVEHKAKADDVEKLKIVTETKSSTEEEKQLAEIVMNLNHSVSPETKKALEALVK
ncbi:MAG TPA: hypothetical protein VLF09_10340 [Cellvibrio sp.]|nr:hypothetical protein [Cellvibrio sp.]